MRSAVLFVEHLCVGILGVGIPAPGNVQRLDDLLQHFGSRSVHRGEHALLADGALLDPLGDPLRGR
jgi:hypothetical protein